MKNPILRTVLADFHRVSEGVLLRYEFEERTPMSYMGSALTASMPETHEIDLVIPLYDLRMYGAKKMAESFTKKAWMTISSAMGWFDRYIGEYEMLSGVEEVIKLLVSRPSRYGAIRMCVRQVSPCDFERYYKTRYEAIFPPEIDNTMADAARYMNEAMRSIDEEMEKFMGGFGTHTTCTTAKEAALTLETMEKALQVLGVPCRGKRGSHTLYIGNGTDKVQKYNQAKGGKMPTLSKLAKRLLDADTKALIKAGYLDNDLEVTQEGFDELEAMLFETHKAELVKRAKDKLKEEKKENE